jgi:hypothetical protein
LKFGPAAILNQNPIFEKASCAHQKILFLKDSKMKVLFIIRSFLHFSYVSAIIDALVQNDNPVTILFDPIWSRHKSDRVVQKYKENTENIEIGWALPRSDFWRKLIFFSRELLSYISYLERPDQSRYYLTRWRRYLPFLIKNIAQIKMVRQILIRKPIKTSLKRFEKKVPPDRNICNDLLKRKPDVLVATPMNLRSSGEVEYVKAAKALGIPTVVPVLSWDNLTTKGIFHIIPDLTLVWNEIQRQEAMTIHGVPHNQVVVTGSPFFDKWFNNDDMLEDRVRFCQRIGIDPHQPYLVYLGSTNRIAPDEISLIKEICSCIKGHSEPRIRELGLLVRPHPTNATKYATLHDDAFVVWPKHWALPETKESQRDFYTTIYHCVLTIGINTSGMIDAIIMDKPCITILTERYRATQGQATHFQRLLQANVLEKARSVEEAIEVIIRILDGEDTLRKQRLDFVKSFVRPRGLNRQAGEVAARAIEMIAQGRTFAEIESEIVNTRSHS